MKLKASTIRSELNKKIQENELKIQEEQRLEHERLKRELDLKIQREQVELSKAKDIETLESIVLTSALEGNFQVEVIIDEFDYYYDDDFLVLGHSRGFQAISTDSEPISKIKYFVLKANSVALSEADDLLTYHLSEFIDICKTAEITNVLNLLTKHNSSTETAINVETLTLLLRRATTLVQRYLDKKFEEDVIYDDETMESFKFLQSHIDELSIDLADLDFDDPMETVVYERHIISWNENRQLENEDDGLLNGRYFNWIANKDGQRFFNLTEWAIAQCVKDLSSQLTLGLAVEKSKTTVVLITPNIAGDYDGNLATPEHGILCPVSPLSPQHFVRIFKHLGFKVSLAQTDGDTESYTLELQW